ncbi:hypothetical protein UCCLBBS449_1257 [Levilactobacillus brevis]|uniref:Uncharacterized protein n=1 Tax=Levilactobacillus brevis TaxID=1580 RepID=A0A5B7XZJ0_LEVBR|nr:hypothetical protein UCCLBBS449_1257 [Levilactobacillus brevis]
MSRTIEDVLAYTIAGMAFSDQRQAYLERA